MKHLIWVLALLPGLAFGGSATLSWTAPTLNTDNSAISSTGPTAIASYRAEYGTCTGGAFGTRTGEVVVAAPTLSVTLPNLPAQLTCFRVYAKNNAGVESDPSNVVSKLIPEAKPQPPGNLTVAALTAYQLVKSVDKLAFSKVGTVPNGTVCDLNQPVGPYHVVPRSAVTWSVSVKAQVVVAQCS
jgi:hypothetical protein